MHGYVLSTAFVQARVNAEPVFEYRVFFPSSTRLSRVHLGQEDKSQPRPTPPRLRESSRPGPISSSPLKSNPIRRGPIASSTSAIQRRGHLISSSATTSPPEKLVALGSRSLLEGTDWDFHHTLVDLILSAQATGGEPPPSTMGHKFCVPKCVESDKEPNLSRIWEYKPEIANNPSYKSELMENNNRTLKELVTPDVLYQPWCTQYL
ncbi:hypothetical protein CR513_30401, partial [Mucuna pruriens]